MNEITNIHIQMDNKTREKWIKICNIYYSDTESKVFRHLVDQLYTKIDSIMKSKDKV